MNFKDVESKTVMRHWMCPEDGCDGEMKYTCVSIDTSPPIYPHICDQCGYEDSTYGEAYPKIVLEEPQ